MKVYAGIVLYQPEREKLLANIRAIIHQVDELVLVDNGSNGYEELCAWLAGFEHLTLIRNAENMGIAAALNQLCSYGVQHGYDCCLTLDQDSVCPESLVGMLLQGMAEDVAVVGPNIVYRGNEQFAEHRSGMEPVGWVITSASLTNLHIWQQLGGFDEKLFIDGVDRDYCVRARRAGFRILKQYDAELLHELGRLKCLKLGPLVINVTNHSAFRRYYMTRNAILLDRKFGEHRAPVNIIKNALKVMLFEDHKGEKLRAILRGIYEGIH